MPAIVDQNIIFPNWRDRCFAAPLIGSSSATSIGKAAALPLRRYHIDERLSFSRLRAAQRDRRT